MATKAKTTLTTIKTVQAPDGIAAFAHLTEPDEGYGNNGPKHCITVFWDKTSDDFKAFVTLLKAANKKYLVSIGRMKQNQKAPLPKCLKVCNEKTAKTTGQDVGTPYIEFATKPHQDDDGNWIPVKVYNAEGDLTRKRVYGTDVVSIECTITGWVMPESAGIKCYLGAVQLLESRYQTGRSNAGSTFGARQEYIVDGDDEDDATGDEPTDAGLEDEDLDVGEEEEADDDLDLGGDEDDPSGGLV